ncbi:MAG: sulfite exporter TauE/SafE family protein [Chloroflexota bacterium]|nr:sulfite exporter TauE/SafE family protein [Chloroflexota bacterium]
MSENIVGLLVLGLFTGVLSGMFGIGGGVVIVPILTTALFSVPLQTAIGTSLGALIMPVGILAVMAYYRAGNLKIGVATPVALGLTVGAFLSAQVAIGIPKNILQLMYGIFVILMGWRFGEPLKWLRAVRAHTQVEQPPVEEERHAPLWGLLAIGFGAGIASGLFGIGGGIVIVPFLTGLFKMAQKTAIATSLGALLLPVSLPAVLTYARNDAFDIEKATLIAVGLLFGAFLGARLALSLPSARVKQLYGLFLIIVGIRFIFFG